jgi:hypothetical protein
MTSIELCPERRHFGVGRINDGAGACYLDPHDTSPFASSIVTNA